MRLPLTRLLQHSPLVRSKLNPKSTLSSQFCTRRTMTTPQLPPLPEITRLSPSCIRILAGNPGKFTLQGTNTYLLGTGPSRILIDTGEGKPSWLAALKRVLQDEKASVTTALITHWHHDHVGGVEGLLEAFGGGDGDGNEVRVYKHRPEAQPPQGSERVEEEGRQEFEYEQITDGQKFTVPGATLTAYHTPGHTTDHMSFFWEEEGALFTGDNVLGHGTSVFEDLGAYVTSLERMRGLYKEDQGSRRAYPGHGPVIEDGPGKIAEYIRHRAQREEQVVQLMRPAKDGQSQGQGEVAAAGEATRNAWTVMELVRDIYRDVPESLHPAAAGGVVQILRKLQREGRAVVVDDGDEERWRLKGAGSPGRSAL